MDVEIGWETANGQLLFLALHAPMYLEDFLCSFSLLTRQANIK